jgi:hypothetical protein
MKQTKKEQLWESKIKAADKSYFTGFDGMFYKQKKVKRERPIEIHFKFTEKYRIYLDVVYRDVGVWESFIKPCYRVKVFDASNTISLKNEPIFRANIKYAFKRLSDITEIAKYII